MCKIFYLFFLGLTMISCTKPAATVMMTEEYPALYQEIFARDADSILTFTGHKWEAVKNQAWRAMISTPIDDTDEFIELVKQANTEEAWAALSQKDLNEDQLDGLMEAWDRTGSLRAGISEVLGQQGNEKSLRFLTRNIDRIIFSSYEKEAALAIGRLIGTQETDLLNEDIILGHAAVQEDPELVLSYFYGHYRYGKKIKKSRSLKNVWETYLFSDDPAVQQYMLKIAFQSDSEGSFRKLDISEVQQMNVQLAIELSGVLGEILWSEKLRETFGKLLDHSNPVVNEVALTQIKNHPEKPQDFDEVIISKIVENEEKEATVRLLGIEALSSPQKYIELADSLSSENEYLLAKKLKIYQEVMSTDEYLSEIEVHTKSDNRMEVLFAVQALDSWWPSLAEHKKNKAEIARTREILFEVLNAGDRSITYSVQNLLMSSELIQNNDYQHFEEILTRFTLPEDVEVYQAMSAFFKERFTQQAEHLIDSLAAKGNVALNKTLNDQGWEIPEVEGQQESFREPDWERLLELGFNPVWALETGKGIIKVEMDILSAPVTISGMDSLITSGAYNGVAFHRVAPNFVVQGGDVETGDGFGGPDYVVPTEASEKHYRRGMVGIASAGTDTEGSQYFFMHQWAPHLNGRYTIVGEVVEGMEVVDQLMVGDKVEEAYWMSN